MSFKSSPAVNKSLAHREQIPCYTQLSLHGGTFGVSSSALVPPFSEVTLLVETSASWLHYYGDRRSCIGLHVVCLLEGLRSVDRDLD